jgi:alpha-tubulin suppressor-like RCC1 family protein
VSIIKQRTTFLIPACGLAALELFLLHAGCSNSSNNNAEPGRDATPDRGVIYVGHSVIAISGRGEHLCAILDDNSLSCLGANHAGQIGSPSVVPLPDGGYLFDDKNVTSSRSVPIGKAVSVSAAGSGWGGGTYQGNTCAIRPDAQALCWGSDYQGELGRGSDAAASSPLPHPEAMPIARLAATQQIDVNGNTACALGNGSVSCWGYNDNGMLGRRDVIVSTFPLQIDLPSGHSAKQISVAERHVCAVLDDGTVACWGDGGGGAGGWNPAPDGGTIEDAYRVSPYVIPSLNGIAEVRTSTSTCVRTETGQVKCFGWNGFGNLGRGSTRGYDDYDYLPGLVELPGNSAAIGIAVATTYGCALLSDGSIWCWGNNEYEQLGSSRGVTAKFSAVPIKVEGLPAAATAVAATNHAACALLSDQTVMCWGSNEYGIFGEAGDGGPQPIPINF